MRLSSGELAWISRQQQRGQRDPAREMPWRKRRSVSLRPLPIRWNLRDICLNVSSDAGEDLSTPRAAWRRAWSSVWFAVRAA